MATAARQAPLETCGELLIVAPTPIVRRDGDIIVDKKFAAGVALFKSRWDGSIRILARQGEGAELPFSSRYSDQSFPFQIYLLAPGEQISRKHLEGAAVILAAGDDHTQYDLARLAAHLNIPLAFTVENPLRGTLEIIWIERRGLLRRLKSSLWAILSEWRRRKAFRLATGLHANGAPAQDAYRNAAPRLLPFFDTRMGTSLFSADEEIEARAAQREQGEPLRLAFSGRLEQIKGVDHLLEVARRLREARFPYTLDVYGSGAMEGVVREAAAAGLLRYHGAVDFESELVPALRTGCDIFISCHRQGDPSCTYLEALGCGTPILGYGNRAFRGLMQKCDGGWVVRKNSAARLAAELMRIDRQRHEITRKAFNGRDFSRHHSFEATFERRIAELSSLAQVGSTR